MKAFYILVTIVLFVACNHVDKEISEETKEQKLPSSNQPKLVILGTIQDAGSPHIACKKQCCATLFKNPDQNRQVVSLGLIDPVNEKSFLFEATPNISSQLKRLSKLANLNRELPDGIFLTHAHIGHYSGLMYLGKEATNAKNTVVYAMARMKGFLEQNGPWSQLVSSNNISISEIFENKELVLTPQLKVIPFSVPHRDEFSETVGYKVIGPNKSIIFIPDIDKWEKWEQDIAQVIGQVDLAFLDATFYDGDEINTRDISEIPHPFIIESIEKFKNLTLEEKNKIHFIHFNHTNPVLNQDSEAFKKVRDHGFHVAQANEVFSL